MTDQEILDLRRTDQRANVLETPYWLTSAAITNAGDDLVSLLFSFPTAGKIYYIHQMIFNVTAVFDGSASITVGTCTLATNAVTTGGDCTIVDLDEYFTSTEITEATIAPYLPGVSADFGAAWLANASTNGTLNAEMFIHGAATTVPCIGAWLTGGTITVGSARLNVLISEVPSR